MKIRTLVLPIFIASGFWISSCGGTTSRTETDTAKQNLSTEEEVINGQESSEYDEYVGRISELTCLGDEDPILKIDLNGDGKLEHIVPIDTDSDSGNCIYATFVSTNDTWEKQDGFFIIGTLGMFVTETKTNGWFDVTITLTENGGYVAKTYTFDGIKYVVTKSEPIDEGMTEE